jgi:glycosyltransferase involved in cell wall biosynthesis
MKEAQRWISCQIGAREHYAVPRALQRVGALEQMVTDIWIRPDHPLAAIKVSLRQRFHPDLENARVASANYGSLFFELRGKMAKRSGWPLIIERNDWFQRMVVRRLQSIPEDGEPRTLFAYSYAAREILRFARRRGWRTVLGQIDPGPVEEEIVAAEVERERSLAGEWQRAPAEYWKYWREECELADHIVVNSQWSRQCLNETGVPLEKLHLVPLAFEAPAPPATLKKYPSQFTIAQPLRVLFLGQVNLRKGVARLLAAARALRDEPIEFLIVGPLQIKIPERLMGRCRIRFLGSVTREKAREFYQKADVFILSTLSDGFALTQLEALAHRLPVIASARCGEVVRPGENGLLLQEPSPEVIEGALRFFLERPDQLAAYSSNAAVTDKFSVSRLAERLLKIPA